MMNEGRIKIIRKDANSSCDHIKICLTNLENNITVDVEVFPQEFLSSLMDSQKVDCLYKITKEDQND